MDCGSAGKFNSSDHISKKDLKVLKSARKRFIRKEPGMRHLRDRKIREKLGLFTSKAVMFKGGFDRGVQNDEWV